MSDFILLAIFALLIGGFPSLVITKTLFENRKSIIQWIFGIIIAFLIGAFFFSMCFLQNKHDEKLWNNGYCTQCGNSYHFVNAQHEKNSGNFYYYVCDNCGKIIELKTHF